MGITIHKNFNCSAFLKTSLMKAVISYLAVLGMLISSTSFAADSGDLLSGALESIKGNFGLGSVFIKCLYLMEIYYGWRKWRETHNPLAVGGVVLVALYLTYAIGKWVG